MKKAPFTRTKPQYTVTITPSVRDAGAELAKRRGMPFSTFVEFLLRREIEEDERARAEQRAVANAGRR